MTSNLVKLIVDPWFAFDFALSVLVWSTDKLRITEETGSRFDWNSVFWVEALMEGGGSYSMWWNFGEVGTLRPNIVIITLDQLMVVEC